MFDRMSDKVQCIDQEGKCFAREITGHCRALNGPLYPCPFKKPRIDETNGKRYPMYEKREPRRTEDDIA